MLRPTRPVPRIGVAVRVGHFGGGFERGVVMSVDGEGRQLTVACENGEVLEFVLSQATARFVASTGRPGPRLELLDP